MEDLPVFLWDRRTSCEASRECCVAAVHSVGPTQTWGSRGVHPHRRTSCLPLLRLDMETVNLLLVFNIQSSHTLT